MKWLALFVIVLCFSAPAALYAQSTNCPPPNIGFEDGTFNHWQCDTGRIDQQGVIHLTPTSGPVTGRQTVIDKNYAYPTDFYTGFPTLCPNGSGHSIQLGSGAEDQLSLAESVSYTFTVPSGSTHYNLIFNYAMVLQHPAFQSNQLPRFTIKTFDITDSVYIDCASYNFFVIPIEPIWKVVNPEAAPNNQVFYQDWNTASINLSGYAGKQIRLEFTTNHATHPLGSPDNTPFCYAYIDVNEDCASPITGNAYCTGQPSVTLTSPPGFESYRWYNPNNFSTAIGHSSTLTISPPPPDQTQYAVITASNGCFDTLYTVVSKIDAGFVFKVKDTVYACPGVPADLTAAAITAGSSTDLKYSYYSDSTGVTYLYNPQKITQSGTYYIRGLSPEGCNYVLPVTVIVLNKDALQIQNPAPVIYPLTIDLSVTFPHLGTFTYSYYSNSTGTDAVTDYQHIGVSGVYYVEATNTSTGCSTLAPITVVVNPPAPPVVKTVNTFTPNNDGINDRFSVTVMGYELFTSLKVYNRNGQLVFETRTADGYWDGTVSGKPAPVGTYYWIFEGVNTYYHKTVYQSGYIALIK